ncbi:MAG: phasin family protein [Candidatus Dormibacteria bacterium]
MAEGARRRRPAANSAARQPAAEPRRIPGQREAERLLSELRGAGGRAQGRAASAAGGFDKFIEGRIEIVLNRVNIPSRSDIERLNRSVDLLTAKVDALLGRHERSGH